ncbi:transglutaminase family protein [Limibaculum sp. M0105]|uniref:Transglutaminase family protein n=1 Tax=Thermohalobaculum xanthum TaxID=2753746 RepID=A0A8J7SF71_9RHOB|nr:transglutaminase family protein [Thermohalobaculum xanthum]MBK0401087.1 transglutaminase family protein [Thermohalobaculum xanthum]
MSINAAITHRTTYRYDRRITLGPQVIRLRPAPHSRTKILAFSQKISPEPHFINWQQDPFGNYLARVVFPEKVESFEVVVDLVADMAAVNPFDFFLEDSASHVPFSYQDEVKKDLAPYLETAPHGPRFEAMLAGIPRERMHTVDFLVEVNRHVQQAVGYTIRMEPGVQTPEETLQKATGSCRDSGWLLVHLLRRLGLAARFVSGYLIQLTPDVKAVDGPSGPEADFTDLHAWCEVYVPGAGWIGLDPTSGLFAGEGHIPLAATPSPKSAAPISGVLEKCEVSFDHQMEVRRVREEPRVTLPFTDEHWARIDAAGHEVDRMLDEGDVRLTMGGEPTFVSAHDRDADEWNTAAVGPTKRDYADRLIRRLRDAFAPGGVLHYGQGKWYPGEQLPRWAFALYWRRDGVPLWHDPELIATERRQDATIADAERFAGALAEALELPREAAEPAWEDPITYVLQEHRLPQNLDPANNRLEDPLERRQMAQAFERGLGTPTCIVIPCQLAMSQAADGPRNRRIHRWATEKWKTRRGRLYLAPGDSAAGYRLPLTSLPFLGEGDYPFLFQRDPFAQRPPLPVSTLRMQPRDEAAGVPPGPQAERPGEAARYWDRPSDRPASGAGGAWVNVTASATPHDPARAIHTEYVRTAVTVEPRDGKLCVFMPPVPNAESYVDLIAAVEEAAAATGQPVHLDGYSPPWDPRLNVIKATPDPGVIEVNIQPATSWEEQCRITETLYDAARHEGLDTVKFMHDGRMVGSGGGNHIVVGGASAEDSPFLRRPDLLASLIRYWQRHPSLSYLFSGVFIGPTSQAPRIDEARQDVLYELEIALGQIPGPDGAPPPWLVDRILRDLMTDLTGNTHRAEICIDKLYSPDGPTGRLGLVEFRAFEMPPHPRMAMAQSLVLRALIAWFWRRPYDLPPVRWGTALHDRFMLPHYVWEDFLDVLADLSGGLGIHFDPEWFKAQFEFRFPLLGDVARRGVKLELRAALEPWHVLGETGAIGGTARYVDSSLERVQLRVDGDLAGRYKLLCNGWDVPLTATDRADEHVAGVRFRAWRPAQCLHPTIDVHAPLTFDLWDTWSARSLGGCVYHVAHPGGRSFETQPVNDLEAEGRRMARFESIGHSPGRISPMTPRKSPEFPLTLDLRRQY